MFKLVKTILQPGRPSQETYLPANSQSDKCGKSARNNSGMHNLFRMHERLESAHLYTHSKDSRTVVSSRTFQTELDRMVYSRVH